MMVTGSFLRVLASSGVPLLLLHLLSTTITITTTTTLLVLQPVGAQITTTSVTPSDDAIQACAAEIADCGADVTCVDCIVISSSTSTGADAVACFEEAGIDEVTSSTVTCSNYLAGICCIEKISDSECLENGPFLAYWVCFMEAKGCAGTEITCDGATAGDSGTDDLISTLVPTAVPTVTDAGPTDDAISTLVPTPVPTVATDRGISTPVPTVTDGATDDGVSDFGIPSTVPTPVPTVTLSPIGDGASDVGVSTPVPTAVTDRGIDDGTTDGSATDDGGTDDGVSDGGTDDGVSDGDDGGSDVEGAGEASSGADTTAVTTESVGLASMAFTLSCAFVFLLPLL